MPPEVAILQPARVDPDGATQRPEQLGDAEQDAPRRDDAGQRQLQLAASPVGRRGPWWATSAR
jgi:hypothetical protein